VPGPVRMRPIDPAGSREGWDVTAWTEDGTTPTPRAWLAMTSATGE
jgi:hypothetical protein